MFFNKKGRRNKEAMEIDITSLLDVLVILLVFLLKSYNASDLKLNMVKDLVVPNSDARKLGNHAVVVQVDSNKKVFLNNKKIGEITSNNQNTDLLTALKNYRKTLRTPAEKKSKAINLVFDQKLPYKVMKGVMHTSAIAGFTEFKLIVQGNY
jgi:biopolymer transport protein ExbD|tara:strand:- start:481 stop:936 length:456 start_codon:yes stop_codon:yes gene_type:complete